MSSLETHYAASDIEARILAGIRAAGLNPEQRLSPEELGALDHFHTGGLQASLELLEVAQIRAEDCVLDIGAGLAGCARLLASQIGCHVDCLEMSTDYCTGAVLLNRLTGLEVQINVHQGSALDLPYPADSFDVVWMQNVGMDCGQAEALRGDRPGTEAGRPVRLPGGSRRKRGDVLLSPSVGHRPSRQLPYLRRRDELSARWMWVHRPTVRGCQRLSR
jgi:SAM-dependent methyltransferase